jgi:segregation and condensation protein A
VARPLDVEGATRRLRHLLAERETLDFREALGERPTPADVISLLIAILELARQGEIRLRQPQPFGSVGITRGSSHQAA